MTFLSAFRTRRTQGAAFMWFLIFLFLFVMGAAMAIDLGRVYLAGNFLQDVADSAAHAAATAADSKNPTKLDSRQAPARAKAIVQKTAGGPVDNLSHVAKLTGQGKRVVVEVAGDIRVPFLGFFLENGRIELTRSATASTCFVDGDGGTRGSDYNNIYTCTRPDGVVRTP